MFTSAKAIGAHTSAGERVWVKVRARLRSRLRRRWRVTSAGENETGFGFVSGLRLGGGGVCIY